MKIESRQEIILIGTRLALLIKTAIILSFIITAAHAEAIIEYPQADLSEEQRTVKIGGKYRKRLPFSVITLTNEMSKDERELYETIKQKQRIESLENIIEYYEKLENKAIMLDDAAMDYLLDFATISVEQAAVKSGDDKEWVIDPTGGAISHPIRLNIKGRHELRIGWGFARRAWQSQELADDNNDDSRWIWEEENLGSVEENFFLENKLAVRLTGTIADVITLTMDHRSDREDNVYSIQYQPSKILEDKVDPRNRKIVRDIQAGDVNLNLGGRNAFITYGGINKDAFGIRVDLEKQHLFLEEDSLSGNLILSLSKGVTEEKVFTGNKQIENIEINSARYQPQRFYDLGKPVIQRCEVYQKTDADEEDESVDLVLYSIETNGGIVSTNEILFERMPNNYFELDQANGELRFNRTLYGSTVVAFFTYMDGLTRRGIPLTNEVDSSGHVFPYDRSDTNYNKYTTLSNYNYKRLVDTNDILYQNYVVLYDEDERDVNPYELRNRYRIERGVDEEAVEIRLFKKDGNEEIGGKVHVGSASGNFEQTGPFIINSSDGYLEFEKRTPFMTSPSFSNYEIYSYMNTTLDNNNGRERYSDYYLQVKLQKSFNVYSLRFNIVPGSEVVKRNGIIVPDSKYKIDYMSGRLYFIDPNFVGAEDRIEVIYEYTPFGSVLQNTLLGARVNYELKTGNEIGMTILHSSGQRPTGAPYPDTAPASRTVFDVNAVINTMELFNFKDSPWTLNFTTEFAVSWQDLNTMDRAIVLDMEGDEDTLYLRKWESSGLYLTYNPQIENKNNYKLGKLKYIDFHEYKATSKNWRSFTYDTIDTIESEAPGQIKDFSDMPGPYYFVGEGHLDHDIYPNQSVYVFDYEFDPTNDAKYVSVVQGFNRTSGRDASGYDVLEIIAKLLPQEKGGDTPKKVFLMVELGSPTEDFDGDGINDFEINRYDGNGLEFNYSSGSVMRNTKQGLSATDTDSEEDGIMHNYKVDTEDLDEDGQHETVDNVIAFPSDDTIDTNSAGVDPSKFYLVLPSEEEYLSNTSEYNSNGIFYEMTNIAVSSRGDIMRDTPYMRIRMPIRSDLSSGVSNTLIKSKAMRFSIIHSGESGEADKGRLILSELRFKAIRWTDLFVDGEKPASSKQFSASIINSKSDTEMSYGSGKRLIDDDTYADDYTELHGSLSEADKERLSESALKLEYSLNNMPYSESGDGKVGTIDIYNSGTRKYDLSLYKEFNFYVLREDWSGSSESGGEGLEYLTFKFGEATNRCFFVRIPAAHLNRGSDSSPAWNKVTIKLQEDGSDNGDSSYPFKILVNGSAINDKEVGGVTLNPESGKIGNPSLTKVKMFSFSVDSSEGTPGESVTGSLWINELYVNDDEVAQGWAWRGNTTFAYDKELKVGNFPILDNVRMTYSHTEKGKGFGSVGQGLSRNETKADTFSFSAKFLKIFSGSLGISKNENLSETETTITPKEEQKYSRNKSKNLSLRINHGVDFLPNLSHSYSENVSKNFNVSRINATNEDSLKINKNETRSRSFGFNQNYAFNNLFGVRGFRLNQKYNFSASISKVIKQAVSNVSEEDIVFERDDDKRISQIVEHFYDDENEFDSSMKTSDISKMQDQIEDAKYTFTRNHDGELRLNSPILNIDLGLTHKLSHNTEYSEAIAEALSGSYEENYFRQIPDLFNDNIIDNVVTTNYSYDTNGNTITNVETNATSLSTKSLSSKQNISIKKLPLFGNISLNFRETYTESGFQNSVKKSYNNLLSRFTNTSEFLSNYNSNSYNTMEGYKNVSARFNSSMRAEINFAKHWKNSPLIAIPVSYSRSLNINERSVPMHSFTFNDEKTDFDMNRYVKNAAPVFFKPPWYYIDPPFAKMFRNLSWLASRKDENDFENAGFNGNNRHNASEMVSGLMPYVDPKTLDYTQPYANDSYGLSASLNEQYTISFRFKNIKIWSVFFPTSFSYTTSLNTTKSISGLGRVDQSDNFSFRTGQRLKIAEIVRLFNDKARLPNFWKNFYLNYSLSYRNEKDYNQKILKESVRSGLNTVIRFKEKYPLRIQMDYDNSITRQYLRFSPNSDDFKFMGIGEYNPESNGVYTTYNVGDFEYYENQVSGDNQITPLVDSKRDKKISIKLGLDIPVNKTKIFRRELETPMNFTHSIKLDMPFYKWVDYDDKIEFSKTGTTNEIITSEEKYAESLIFRSSDISEEFMRLNLQYNTAFNLQKNISVNIHAKMPFHVYHYFGGGTIDMRDYLSLSEEEQAKERSKIIQDYNDRKKTDVALGFEVGGSVVIKF